MALARTRERIRIGRSWLVDADIRAFFDSIPHDRLLMVLKKFIRDRGAMRLLGSYLAQGAHHAGLLRKPRGISQGAVLSPLFCNLFLNGFDHALTRAGIPFVRFADDFLLFADKKFKAKKALDFAAGRLADLGLQLHPEKTRIIRSCPEVLFLGKSLPPA